MHIPKIIHHIAPKNREIWHPVWLDCYNSCKVNFPEEEYKHILWNDEEDIDLLIKTEYPHYWKEYKKFPLHIRKIDFARLAILEKYGGIYLDMDVYCYKNFYEDLEEKDCCLVECSDFDRKYDKDNEIVANFLIASKPNHVFIRDLMDLTISNNKLYDKKVLKKIILKDHKKKSHYIIENSIILMSKLYKKYDKSLIHILPKFNYNNSIFVYHKNKKIQHMFTGVWGKEDIKRISKDMKECEEDISYEDYLKESYKLRSGLDLNLFKFKP